ncbi:MAG: PEP-CTERM sorting domain-containing protein [Desulfobacterales bacterium]|nr:PEP-CTERM sorting domain-containing protein [Desulfobacterales bacterium]
MKIMKKLLLLITLVVGVIAFALPAQATTLTFDLDIEFSGADEPQGEQPPSWLTASFDDGNTPGTVTLTMTATNLMNAEHIKEWYFNFESDYINVNLLSIIHDSGIAATTVYQSPDPNATKPEYKADGDGLFDLYFDFQNTFGVDDTAVYIISDNLDNGVITVESFNLASEPENPETSNPKPGYFSAAHIGGIYDPLFKDEYGNEVPNNTEGSGWIGDGDGGWPHQSIPEPATMLLLGSGLIGIAVSGKKRFKRRNG